MRHNKTISGQRDTTLVQFNVLDQLLYLRHIKEGSKELSLLMDQLHKRGGGVVENSKVH